MHPIICTEGRLPQQCPKWSKIFVKASPFFKVSSWLSPSSPLCGPVRRINLRTNICLTFFLDGEFFGCVGYIFSFLVMITCKKINFVNFVRLGDLLGGGLNKF